MGIFNEGLLELASKYTQLILRYNVNRVEKVVSSLIQSRLYFMQNTLVVVGCHKSQKPALKLPNP